MSSWAPSTGDRVFPSTACRVQDVLGAKNAFAFDVSAACAGFMYGLSTARDAIRAGHGTHGARRPASRR